MSNVSLLGDSSLASHFTKSMLEKVFPSRIFSKSYHFFLLLIAHPAKSSSIPEVSIFRTSSGGQTKAYRLSKFEEKRVSIKTGKSGRGWRESKHDTNRTVRPIDTRSEWTSARWPVGRTRSSEAFFVAIQSMRL